MGFKFNALHNLLAYILLLAATATAVAGQALPGCRTSCGDLSITYPFGVGEGCYRDENFRIDCDFSSGTPTANYSASNIQVLNITLDGELTTSFWVASICFNRSGHRISGNDIFFWLNQFTVSSTKNNFYVVGCDSLAFIIDFWGRRFSTGCTSTCKNKTDVTNGSCAGIGCCQSIFPQGTMGYNITFMSFNNHTKVSAFNPCTYAFVAEEGAFNFSTLDLQNLRNKKDFPLVINWAIGTENCTQVRKNATSYACKENSYCESSKNAPGYLCKCNVGYQGNPYLNGSNGCQDIDECKTSSPCSMTCHNFDGGYNCSCPSGFTGDGFKNGTGCISESAGGSKKGFPFIETALGISVSLLVIFMVITTLCCIHKQRKLIKLRNKFFEQNGGNILQNQLSERQGYSERTKVFTEAELEQATNNFHETRILGHGGQGTVYKGILPDNTLVAIKKSRIGDQSQVKDFINEVIVLSQINHRNVVRILGCCLETEVPLLVYEYVPNGTLLDHIDPAKNASSIRWETRLRIAAETAGAISYLHSAASVPIIHRDIKSSNILLDNNHNAKVSDFGASRLVPLDQTNVSTLVQGTLGYLDPEYLQTGQLNEKSDVYSFGVVLVELLTGKKAVEFNRPEQQRNLAMHFVSSMKEDRLLEILDREVLSEKNVNQLKEVALLARRCLRVNGEERPSMKEVAMELDGHIAMEKHPWVRGDVMSEENEYLLGNAPSNAYSTAGIGSSANYDSIQMQTAFEIEDGR